MLTHTSHGDIASTTTATPTTHDDIATTINTTDTTEDDTPSASELSRSISLNDLNRRSEAFGVRLFNSLRQNGVEENVVVAPYSIYVALGMVMAGASGETRDELSTAMQASEFKDGVDDTPFHAAMQRSLENATAAGFNSANSIWLSNQATLRASFSAVLDEFYDATGRVVDFRSNPDAARTQINDWVADKTEQRIKDLLPSGSITSDTYSVLCNAIYFKEKWANRFSVVPQNLEFYLPGDGGSKAVPFISTKQDLRYFYDSKINADIVFVPYQKAGAMAVVIVPRERNGLATMRLADDTISNAFSQAGDPQEVSLSLPKFKVETKQELSDKLQLMGVQRMFGEAQFDRMTDVPLFVSGVHHGAFVAVDEDGTEAAAATGVVIGLRSMPTYPMIRANHPFFFGLVNVLPDGENIATVFLGAINNPSSLV